MYPRSAHEKGVADRRPYQQAAAKAIAPDQECQEASKDWKPEQEGYHRAFSRMLRSDCRSQGPAGGSPQQAIPLADVAPVTGHGLCGARVFKSPIAIGREST